MATSKAREALQVGSTVFRFDYNRRVYAKGDGSGPIWREHWEPVEIVSETRVSWVTRSGMKLPKKEGESDGYQVSWVASELEVEQLSWVHDSYRAMHDALDAARFDFARMQQVADALGVPVPERLRTQP